MEEKIAQEVKYLLEQWDASVKREQEWRDKIHQERSEQLAMGLELRKMLRRIVSGEPGKS